MDHFKRSLFSNHPEWDLRRIQEDRSGPFSWDIKVTFKAILKRSLKKQRNDSNCDGKFCEGFQNGIWNVSNDPYGTLKEFLIMIFEGFLQNGIRSLNDPSKKKENISSEIVRKISKRDLKCFRRSLRNSSNCSGIFEGFFFCKLKRSWKLNLDFSDELLKIFQEFVNWFLKDFKKGFDGDLPHQDLIPQDFQLCWMDFFLEVFLDYLKCVGQILRRVPVRYFPTSCVLLT